VVIGVTVAGRSLSGRVHSFNTLNARVYQVA